MSRCMARVGSHCSAGSRARSSWPRATAALVLKDEEQRDLLENVARGTLRSAWRAGRARWWRRLRRRRELLAFVFRATALDMVRQGRADEMREILRDVFGEEHAQALARQIDDWAREPESLR